jgi:hypothetical protein
MLVKDAEMLKKLVILFTLANLESTLSMDVTPPPASKTLADAVVKHADVMR